MKIYIPKIEEYKAIKFKDKDQFIKELDSAYNVHVYEIDGDVEKVSFHWNPYGNDYPPLLSVRPGEIFMYNIEDKDSFMIINHIPDWWVVSDEE